MTGGYQGPAAGVLLVVSLAVVSLWVVADAAGGRTARVAFGLLLLAGLAGLVAGVVLL